VEYHPGPREDGDFPLSNLQVYPAW
jgi:hypothetical protein